MVFARWDRLAPQLARCLHAIIAQFMDHTRVVKFLVTCRNDEKVVVQTHQHHQHHQQQTTIPIPTPIPPYKAVKAVSLDPLDPIESATLLYRLLPREVTMEEILASDSASGGGDKTDPSAREANTKRDQNQNTVVVGDIFAHVANAATQAQREEPDQHQHQHQQSQSQSRLEQAQPSTGT